MALKPWYKVITPREDLRDGRPLDASEFAVHLDHVRMDERLMTIRTQIGSLTARLVSFGVGRIGHRGAG